MDIKEMFQSYYVSALKRYVDFKGRTDRKAFWMFVLFNVILSWATVALDNILGTTQPHSMMFEHVHYGVFYNLYSLALVLPTLAIIIRRLQDVGKTWSYLFYVLIPVVGAIILILQLIKEGDPNENEYGPVPAEDPSEPTIGGHPYAPNDGQQKDKVDVPAVRKEAPAPVSKKKKSEKTATSVKVKKVKWGRDRGAIDFTKPSNGSKKI